AERTEKLRVVGELAASVAHDLNNTLAAVLGRAEVIAESTGDPEARRNADVIAQAARDASLVVGRLTRISRKSHKRSDRFQVDLVKVVRDAVELTRSRWSRDGNVQLELTDPGSPVSILGSATELGEVFTNLILNAVDALPGGGKIRCSIAATAREAVAHVEDDGHGMTDEVLSHAFEPFFTTKGERGTGLGLSICAAIVEGHGGRIDARSSPDRGTLVRVTLPLASESTPPPGEAPRATLPRRVLVVDDDARVRALLSDVLSAEGHSVRTAASGEEALALVRSGSEPIDLLVTDVAMPGMSGLALAGELREHDPDVGIVLVSGWAASATPEALARLRATLLQKPFRTEDVRAQVAAATEAARSAR
ncbi:response regulator, partial [bacterium]|nr:response regulator [bacterium]